MGNNISDHVTVATANHMTRTPGSASQHLDVCKRPGGGGGEGLKNVRSQQTAHIPLSAPAVIALHKQSPTTLLL